ncbi:MAG: phage holin family protein [Candidatus Limnocylindrales bacterium]
MIDWVVRIVINAVALIVAAKIIPNIHLILGPLGIGWVKVGIVALVFALVNTYVKPIVRALSFPITLVTLGLFAFVINAALFLLVAWIAKTGLAIPFTVGGFPPTLGSEALIAALLGSIVVSVVSTILGMANFGRKVAGLR